MNARSLLFAIWFYLWMVIFGFTGLFTFLISRRAVVKGLRVWSQGVLWGLRVFGGVRIEVRGREHLPAGKALIAAKHQAMVDTLAPFVFLDDVCFVLKEELTKLPLFGWYCVAARMIALNRGGQASALKALVRDSKDRLKEDRQIIIYPEGTRGPLGSTPEYKPGVAALYGALDTPCIPMATNSGAHWSHRGIHLTPGVVVFEFLPAIPPGLKRAEFMQRLEETVETASNRLVAEGI
jgi:1-acyl-sn-glycerol-3-phosphate acyltransferase